MLINPNLYTGKLEMINDGQSAQHWNGVFIELDKNLIENKYYTISFHFKRININEKVLSETITVGCIKEDGTGTARPESGYKDVNINDGIAEYTFLYKSDIERIWATTNSGYYPKVGAIFSQIKIEEGKEPTPYIPNKNSVKADKQAIFVAGGVFREVYPL